jgi:hypothetical protein
MSGQGTFYFSGFKYEGEWQRGMRHGSGELTSRRGKIIYKGEWKDDQKIVL